MPCGRIKREAAGTPGNLSAPQPRKSSGFTQEPCYFCATASPVQTSCLRKALPRLALGTSRSRDGFSPAPIWMVFFALPGLVNKLLKHSCQTYIGSNGLNNFTSSNLCQNQSLSDRPRAATQSEANRPQRLLPMRLRAKNNGKLCRRKGGLSRSNHPFPDHPLE